MVASAEAGAEAEPALRRGLEVLTRALGAAGGAVYAKEATSGTLRRRVIVGARGGAEAGLEVIPAAAAPRLMERLVAGEAVTAGAGPAGDELAALGGSPGLLVPARAGGQTVGAVALALQPGRRLTTEEVAALAAATQALALGLRNAQLFAGLQERAHELDRQVRQLIALTEVARGVARSVDPEDLRRRILAEARRLVRAERAALLLPGPGGGLVTVAGDPAAERPPEVPAGALERAARGGGVWAGGATAVAAVPAGEGGAGAALVLARRAGEPFDDDDVERLRGLADQAGVALANARLVADLRREQSERGALAAALVVAQEEERRRVAEDIHDGPVQELVGLALALDALSGELRAGAPGLAGDADRAAARARDAVRALREAIFDLHPMALEELGFAAATRALAQRLEWRGMKVELDVQAADVLAGTPRTVAFRAVQEAMANAVRHADASRVRVTATLAGGSVELEVSDDGRGFDADPERARARIRAGHLGLAAVRERVALVDGRLEVDAAEGRGTTVRIVLPLAAGAAPQPPDGGGSRSSAAPSDSGSANRSSTTT